MRLDKYLNYSVTELAADPAFIAWVKHPGSKHDEFWEEFVRRHPGHSDRIEKAKSIVSQMHIRQNEMNAGRTKVVWNNIATQILGNKFKPAKIVRRSYWIPAAAVLILALMGTWWLLNRNNAEQTVVDAQAPIHDIAPGTNKAILTLADGTKIILDSAHTGAISQQGNVTVIKLNDGLLSYDPSSTTPTSSTIKYNTITTPRGGQYQLVLADGSKVWLNAASSLRFPNIFPEEKRVVELTGEGYFEIAHDAQKPFFVKVGELEVKVLGTHFNVNAYEDDGIIKTTLLEGSIEVQAGEAASVLAPGQQLQYKEENQSLNIKRNIDLDHIVAWKEGYFSFDGDRIEEIMNKIARWYDVHVIFQSNKPEGHFSGIVSRNTELSGVMYALQINGVAYQVIGKTIIIK